MNTLCCKAYVLIYVACACCCTTVLGDRIATPRHFHAVAMKVQTDKVIDHHYEFLYEKYLQHLVNEKLRLLEGGKSIPARCKKSCGKKAMFFTLWTEYLPNSEISFVEFDAICAETYRGTIEEQSRGTLYVGDQANVTFLMTIVDDQAGKLFDVIIDDGGHTMEQQRTTISHLWQLVAPGGIFVMEDLLTSYMPQYGGGPKGHPGTMIEMHKDFLDELHCKHQTDCKPTLPGLLDMDCYSEACVMVKQTEPVA